MRPIRLSSKLTVLVVLAVIVTAAVGSSLTIYIGSRLITREVETEMVPVVQTYASAIDNFFENARALIGITADSPAVKRPPATQFIDPARHGVPADVDVPKRASAQRILRQCQFFNYIMFLLPDGSVYLLEPYELQVKMSHGNLAFLAWYKELRSTGRTVISNLHISPATRQPSVDIAAPVRDAQGRIVGVWVAGLKLEHLSEIGRSGVKEGKPSRYGYVTDRRGLVIAHQGNAVYVKEQADFYAEPGVRAALSGERGVMKYMSPIENREHFVAYMPLASAKWAVMFVVPTEVAFAPLHDLTRIIALVGGGLALLMGLVSIVLVRKITVPLSQLRAAAEEIGRGDFKRRIEVKTGDEIEELARTFNSMALRLGNFTGELEADVKKRTRELSVLCAIAHAAGQTLDLQQVLKDSLAKVLELLEVEMGGIFLLEPDGETMVLQVHRGLSDEFVEAARQIHLGEGVSGRAAAEKKPMTLNVSEYPTERLVPAIVKEGIQTMASTPLLAAGELVGALNIATHRPRNLLPEEEALLAAIGQELGQAVQNACLHERVQQELAERKRAEEVVRRQRDELLTRQRILNATLATLELDELLKIMLDEALAYLHTEFGSVHLVKGKELVLTCWRGFSDKWRAQMLSFSVDRPLHSLANLQVIHEKLSEQGVTLEFMKQEGIQAWATVPLKLPSRENDEPGEWLGTIVTGSRRYEQLSQEEIRSFEGMTAQVALAVDHARTYRQAQERFSRLQTLREIDAGIIKNLDLPDLLKVVLEGVPQELGADAVAVSVFKEDQKQTKLFMMRLPNGTIIQEEAFRLSESLLGWLSEKREPVIIYDLSQDPRVQMYREHIRHHRLFSYLGTALVAQDRTVGILHILSTKPKVYADEDVAFFQTLAGQAAIAMENARVTERLRESEARYRTVIETSPDAIILTDLKLNLMMANPQALRSSGFEREDDVIGKNVKDFVAPEDWPRMMEQAKHFLETGITRSLEYFLRRKDGSLLPIELRASLIQDEAGEARNFVGIFRDITERKRAQEQISASLKEKEILLAEIHHRVKNNMQLISSLLRLQSRRIKDEELRQAFNDSQSRIQSMALIHEKLYRSKDFSRIELVGYIKDMTRTLLHSYDVDPGRIALKVQGENVFLGINTAVPCGLLLNELISNALKHAFPAGRKGEVFISLHAHGDQVTLTVKDDGAGFPADLDFRKTPSLGLQLVVTLVEQIDGTIELHREGGTEFRITFQKGKRKAGYLN